MINIKGIDGRLLATQDLADSLQFVLKRPPQWANVAAGVFVICGFTVLAWWQHGLILLVFAVVGVVGLASNRLRGRETTLRVSRFEVVARGNLLNSSNEEMTIPLSEITSMGWNAGGQDDSGGLYVANGFRRSYILPGATGTQAREILAAITGKFPGFPIEAKTWASLIWGDESALVDLGLDEPGLDEPAFDEPGFDGDDRGDGSRSAER